MHALRPLRPEPGVPVVALAILVSLLLHALLIAWPRWPTWARATGGVMAGEALALRARLAPDGWNRAQADLAGPAVVAEAPVSGVTAFEASPDPVGADDGSAPASAARSTARVPVAAAPKGMTPASSEREARERSSAAAKPQRAVPPVPATPRPVPAAREPGPPAPDAGIDAPAAAAGDRLPVYGSGAGGAAASASSSAVAAAATPRGAAGAPSDIASIAQYRIALISASRRFKPVEMAPVDGVDVRVDVQLAIDADGSLAAARVMRSSGVPSLDALALDMLRRAKAQAPLPPRLLDRAFEVEVPVVFGGAVAAR